MSLEELKTKLLKNEKFRDEYYKKDLAFEIGQMLFEARVEKGVTQNELAKEIGTKQPSIARIENGKALPSLKILEKIARAFNSYLVPPAFGFMENYPNKEIYPISSGATIVFFTISQEESKNSYHSNLISRTKSETTSRPFELATV